MNISSSQIAIIFSAISILVVLLTYFQRRYAPRELTELRDELREEFRQQITEIQRNFQDLISRTQTLEIKINPFWKVIEEQTLKGLKSNPDPSHVERDRLIDKYLSGQRLLREEARVLAQGFMDINEGKEAGNKGLAVLGLAVLASKYASDIEDMLKPANEL